MEKYSRWSDLSTGINPFVPQRRRFTSGWPVTCLQMVSGSLLAVVRIPLVLVATLVLALVNVIVSILAIIPFLGRLIKRLTDWLLCTLLLLLLGVFASEEAANSRRLGLVTAKGGHSTGSSRVGPGDVVVCNYTSFVEILYLARCFSPVFVFATEGKTDNGGLVHVCGLPEALYRSLSMPVSAERVKPTRKIADVVRRASGPIVILPEGARSNGKAVLRFIPLLENLPVKTRVHLVAFRYEFKHFSPSHSAGSGWDLNLKELIPATMLRGKKQESSKTLTTVQVEKLRSLLAAMLRTKVVDLGPKDFVSFNAYWKHVNSGGRQPASQFTDRKAPHEHAQWSKR
ncbi:hypothetical protein BBJ29_007778 [Phytophthora kernoviae]|uniref:Phospholipid/glycerol acyltransferase domain-containing protein n=1 Tax=Phytophthora kernoviae TaxID=325452 RepID=A0A3F2RGF7_9STRA|nr:hypothetical protein BBP00_00008792 [Phytophthora kernoviae]RLN65105.1 hypothetical protein BBJ29_007778 [Phytophthora kernoviae]